MKTTRQSTLYALFFLLFIDSFAIAINLSLFPSLFLHPQSWFFPPETAEPTRTLLVGVLFAMFPLGQFFGAPFFGELSDRYGRKRLFAIAILGSIVGYFLTGLALLRPTYSFLVFTQLIAGFFSATFSLAMASMIDLGHEEERRGRYLGYLSAVLGAGWIAALFIGSWMVHPESPLFSPSPSLFWLISGLLIISLCVLLKGYRETCPGTPEKKVRFLKGMVDIITLFEHKKLRALFLFALLWFLGFFIALQETTPLLAEKFSASPKEVFGFFVSLWVVWGLTSALLNTYLIKRFSPWLITLWSTGIASLVFFFSTFADFFLYFTLVYLIAMGSSALSWIEGMNLISLATPKEAQGKAMGIAQSLRSLVQLLAPLMVVFVAATFTSALLFLAAFLFLLFLYTRRS